MNLLNRIAQIMNEARARPEAWLSLIFCLALTACAMPKKVADEDCFALSGGYTPPQTSGYQICAKTVWGSDAQPGGPVKFHTLNDSGAQVFYEKTSYAEEGVKKTELLPLVTTEAVNRSLCRQSASFKHCSYDRSYSSYGGSKIRVTLHKRQGAKECRSMNSYDQTGITRFTVCDDVGSAFLENTSLSQIAVDARGIVK